MRRLLLNVMVFTAALSAAIPGACAPRIQWLTSDQGAISANQATQLRWHVDGADEVSITPGIGVVPNTGSRSISPATTTTYQLTARSGQLVTSASHTVDVGLASAASGRFITLISPLSDQVFTAPAEVRVVVAAFNPTGDNGNSRNAESVEFFVDDTVAATVPASESEYWVFKTTLSGIGPGTHRIWARANYPGSTPSLASEVARIEVEDPPVYGEVMNLTEDLVLSGAADFVVAGTPNSRKRINGNNHTISSANGWSGRFSLTNVDVFNLGPRNDPEPAIDVASRRSIEIENCIFDSTGTVNVTLESSAVASIRDNEFRSNMTMPESQSPEFPPGPSYPAIRLRGAAGGASFERNRIGIGWADFRNTRDWLIADNIVIGPRGGLWVQNSSGMHVIGNIVYHPYRGGWSQANVMELNNSRDVIVEHNVIGGGSWPIRGLGGTLRYNLVLDAGHEWLWITDDGASVHHNVFVGGDGDVAPIRLIYGSDGVETSNVTLSNNTLDGLNAASMVRPLLVAPEFSLDMHSNAIANIRGSPGVELLQGAVLEADHNLFYGQVAPTKNYSDGRWPPHDIGILNAQTDPKFSEPSEPLRYRLTDWWSGRISVDDVLENYRERYTPVPGSPLIDAGKQGLSSDPNHILRSGFEAGDRPSGTFASGNDIGAVGAGEEADDDMFGRRRVNALRRNSNSTDHDQ